MNVLRSFWKEEDGQDLIEYGLLAGAITLASVTAVLAIGTKVGSIFTSVNTKVDGVNTN